MDESQNYKNLYLYTKMRNVAGLSTSEAQKSSDMFGKCRYLDEVTGGRGVIFATGTPISNSMTEMYTLMRYLQYSTLQQKQLTHFDAWASTFGETTTAIELAPEGTGYRARTRFAKFFNLPELMNMFKEAADIKTSDQLHLPVPEAKFETVVVKPSEIQQDMVKSLSERAAEVHSGAVDPSVDNMLKITSDGRKIGLDQRLMNPLTPDDPDSKLNACVDNVLRIWNETKEDNLTQLIFCDMSTPKGDGSFNVYDDIRTKLLAAGFSVEQRLTETGDTEFRFRSASAGGGWSSWITIQRGEKGDKGDAGNGLAFDASGPVSERAQHDAEAKGFVFFATDEGNFYVKNSATSADWSAAIPLRGATGPAIIADPVTEMAVADETWGDCRYLDTAFRQLSFRGRVRSLRRVSLETVSIDSGVTGNIVLVPVVNGSELSGTSFVVAVGAVPSVTTFALEVASGTLALRRDTDDERDTLKDAEGSVTAVVLSVILEVQP